MKINVFVWIWFILFLLTLFYHIVMGDVIYKSGYISACEDFYKGKLKVEMIENPNETHQWKMIDEFGYLF